MMTRYYTDKEKEIIADKAQDLTPEELLKLLEPCRTLAGLYNYLCKNNIHCKRKKPVPQSGPGMALTKEEEQYILDNYQSKNRATMALDLGRSVHCIGRFLDKRGLVAFGSYRKRDYVPPPIKHITTFKTKPKSFTRPPAQYSNTDWSKMYL
jgi:hypothetical protein